MRAKIHAYLGLVVAFAAGLTAQAAPPAPPPSSPSSTEFCKQSTLTGLKFMQLLQTIIRHGDLSDIPFMEKALGTKFRQSHLDYESNQTLGAPIQVMIDTYDGEMKKGDILAVISFNGDSMTAPDATFIQDCLHLSRNEFYADFGTGFIDFPPLPSPPLPGQHYDPASVGVFKYLNNIGKNGSQFELSFHYNVYDLRVSGVIVTQRK